MYELKDIISCAKECREILNSVKTVQDVIDLRHRGISERDIISIDIGEGLNSYDIHSLEEHIPVRALKLIFYKDDHGTIIDNPIIIFNESLFYFDIYDNSIDYDGAIIEDATLETIEQLYHDFEKSSII